MREDRYVPAAGRRALTRLYDPVVALTMRERTFRGQLERLVLAGTARPARIVDVGCGTGTFAISLASHLEVETVIGVDGDPQLLARARKKPGSDRVTWLEGKVDRLPAAPDSADAVVMSLLLHHLIPEAKHDALREAARILKPGGSLHIADWGRPRDPFMRAAFFALQLLDGRQGTAPHARGEIPSYLASAGFERIIVHHRLRTAWGLLELLSARSSMSLSETGRDTPTSEPPGTLARRNS